MWMRDVKLATRTRWKIGGPAPRLAEVGSEVELRERVEELDGAPVRALGGGANLLVSDSGPEFDVIILDGDLRDFGLEGEDAMRFGAAAPIAGVVQAARRNARAGLWILEAVPGTMGGALRMNAGTAENGIWSRVRWAEVMVPDGAIERVTARDVRPRYRAIDLDPGVIFVRGELAVPPGDGERIDEEHLGRRRAKLSAQVYDRPTCGSTWKNPGSPAGSAWELVDRVGMRGARRGGAQVSEKHANFIVNLGGARAEDVIGLMIETRRRVHEETGLHLEPELHFWGFPDDVLHDVGALS